MEKKTNNDIQNIAQKKTFIHKNTTGAVETSFFRDKRDYIIDYIEGKDDI